MNYVKINHYKEQSPIGWDELLKLNSLIAYQEKELSQSILMKYLIK